MAISDDIATLIVLVQSMLDESGDQTGFHAKVWLDGGLTGVVPALGNRRPIDVLNEPDGLEVVKSLLLRAQSGAYSWAWAGSGLVLSQVWTSRYPR